jgi:DNA repair/transcription protein MET18/MMS19
VRLLFNFVEARLGLDPSGFKETVQSLRYLVAMLRFDSACAGPLVSQVFNAAQAAPGGFAKMPVLTRFEVYNLLNELLSTHREVTKATGVDFINMLIELSASERDPRNLMLIFSMVEVVLAEWEVEDIDNLKEDLYEMLSRYFPITFSAKKSDPASINPPELVLRLRKCFAAYSGFAPSILPNLIQRLDDPNRLNAKADVLLTMKACIERYNPTTVSKWSSPLWDALKYEIFNSSDDSQAPKALDVLGAIATRLSGDLFIQNLVGTVLQTYVASIVDECMTRLRENGPKYSASAGAIMASIIAASPFAYHLVMRAAVPELLKEFGGRDASVADKRAVVETVNLLLDGKFEALRRQDTWEFNSVGIIDGISSDADRASESGGDVGVANKGLAYYRDELTAMYMGVARDTQCDDKQFRVAAMQGLAKLLRQPHFLERDSVDSYVQFLAGVVLETADLEEPVRKEAIKALQECAVMYSSLVIEKAFPVLLAALPDVLEGEATFADKLAVLQALGDIGSRGMLMQTLFRRLLSKLDIVVRANESQKYAHLVLAGILYTVEQRQAQNENGEVNERDAENYRSIVDELLRRTAALKVNAKRWYVGTRDLETAGGRAQPDYTFLEVAGRIIMAATCGMAFDDQYWLFERSFALSVAYDDFTAACVAATSPDDLPVDDDLYTGTDISKRIDIIDAQFDFLSGPTDKLRALTLTKYILAALRRDNRVTKPTVAVVAGQTPPAPVPVKKRVLTINTTAAVTNLITYLTTTACTSSLRSTLLDILSLLINKFAALTPAVTAQLLGLFTTLPTLPAQEAKLTIQTLTTCTHASLLAGLPAATQLTTALLTALTLPAPTGQLAAQSFTHLLAPAPLLTRRQHALIRPLAQQRLFHTAVPELLSTFSSSTTSGATKTNVLVALSGLLAHAPEDYITPFIPSLLPPLLQSLTSAPSATKKASIAVLRSAATSSPKALQEHDAALVKRLLACANGRESREVKVKALECLEILPKVWEVSVLVRLRGVVVRGLGSVVGDGGREVRRWGVDCLGAWWRVGEGEGN